MGAESANAPRLKYKGRRFDFIKLIYKKSRLLEKYKNIVYKKQSTKILVEIGCVAKMGKAIAFKKLICKKSEYLDQFSQAYLQMKNEAKLGSKRPNFGTRFESAS